MAVYAVSFYILCTNCSWFFNKTKWGPTFQPGNPAQTQNHRDSEGLMCQFDLIKKKIQSVYDRVKARNFKNKFLI